MFQEQIQRMQKAIEDEKEKKKVLSSMDVFVLDNSLRESTVGQLRGHTIENKWKIYEQVTIKQFPFRLTILPQEDKKVDVQGIICFSQPIATSF